MHFANDNSDIAASSGPDSPLAIIKQLELISLSNFDGALWG